MVDQTDQDHHPKYSRLIGHDNVLSAITGDGHHRRHHGFILNGPKGIGKATAAWRAAERLLASSPEGEASAGLFGDAPETSPAGFDENNPEVRLVRAGSHPDLIAIEADTSKASGGISVDQVRAVIPFLSHTPSRGRYRVVIIDALDDMNVNGANAILKTLEEPPENAVIIIINHQTKPMLPTIRSRVQMIAVSPLGFQDTNQVVRSMFEDADQDWVDVATALSDGAPGKAALFAESGAIDLYAETTQMLAGEQTDQMTIDGLSAQWGAGGVKNLAKRQMGLMLMMRLLARAARHATGGVPQGQYQDVNPRLDIENRAIAQICNRHHGDQLAAWYQQYYQRFVQAERLNLDTAPIYFDLLSGLMTNNQS